MQIAVLGPGPSPDQQDQLQQSIYEEKPNTKAISSLTTSDSWPSGFSGSGFSSRGIPGSNTDTAKATHYLQFTCPWLHAYLQAEAEARLWLYIGAGQHGWSYSCHWACGYSAKGKNLLSLSPPSILSSLVNMKGTYRQYIPATKAVDVVISMEK